MKKLPIFLLGFVAIFAVSCLTSFKNKPTQMSNFNNGDYDSAWKTIDSLERQGLPKSALEKTIELYEVVKTQNEPAQVVKCLLYRAKYESQLEEDGLVNAIFKWEKEIENASYPTKSILQSMLAQIYSGYLNNNRWRFRNRTQTTQWKAEDIRTWTIEQLIEKSGELYMASVQNEETRRVKLDDFDAILVDGRNAEGLRPTLYDFLAHRAIDYFRNEQAHLTQPANKFYIDNPDFFKPSFEFAKLQIDTPDSTSFKYKTLLLFQELTRYRAGISSMTYEADEHVIPLVDVDLKRLKFIYDNAILDNKFELYEGALRQMERSYSQKKLVTEIQFALAQLWFQKGQKYQPNPEEIGKYDWKKALEICDNAIEKYPNSFGARQCQSIRSQILGKHLNITTEQVNLPNDPFLAMIAYRNVPNVFVKVIRMNNDRLDELEAQKRGREAEDKVVHFLNSLPTVQYFSHELPNDGDYRKHSVEVKIDALPYGKYALLVSDNQEFKFKGGAFGYIITQVSNLGFWHRLDNLNRNEYIIFDRRYGTPQSGVTLECWERNYNSVLRKNDYKKIAETNSNADGFVIPNINTNKNFKTLLRKGKDSLDLDNWFYTNRNMRQPRITRNIHFFIDRGIYRPGQTIYFKGILIEKDGEGMPKILPNEKVTVVFKDANRQEVEKLNLTTNEYGTINGTFIAPKTGLLGQMSISSKVSGSRNNQKSFRVEEYKRPKFQVKFEPIEGSYKIDSEVVATGLAKG